MVKNRTHKRHPKLIAFIIFLLACGIFYGWGSIYYQKDAQLNRIMNRISDPKQSFAEYVTASDPDVEVTDSKLKPLQNYFKANKKAAAQLESNLRQGKDSNQIKLFESGTHFLLFPKYTLRVQVYRPQVETNHPNSTLTMDQENYGQMKGADQNFYADLGQLFPGRYHLLVKTKVAGRKLKADSVVNIWSDKTINMVIKTGTFQIRSVPNGVVYINDHKVKKLDRYGQAAFKNYPLAKNTELYITAKYNGETIKSEVVKDLSSSINSEFSASDDDVTDYGDATVYAGNEKQDVYQDVEGDYIVNPLWTGLIDQEEAGRLLYHAYLKPEKELFNGEKTVYEAQQKAVKKFRKGKKKLKLSVKVIKIMPAGNNLSDVSYQLVYKYREKGKKHKLTVNYENALFHLKNDEQGIQKLGEKAN